MSNVDGFIFKYISIEFFFVIYCYFIFCMLCNLEEMLIDGDNIIRLNYIVYGYGEFVCFVVFFMNYGNFVVGCLFCVIVG